MKIAFFEIKEEEKTFFQSHLEKHELFFFENTIQDILTRPEVYEAISLFVHSRISNEILEMLPNLQYLQTRSSGFEHLKCTQLYKKGLEASNVTGYAGPAVAEFAYSLLLNATRKTHIALNRSKNANAEYLDLKGIELFGKTVGIVGLGTIGLQMAKIAKGFGMKIFGYSRTRKPLYDELDIHFSSLEEVLKNADILMLAVPLSPSTRNMINEKNSLLIKKECIIINIARAEIIQDTLYHTLPHTICCDIDGDLSLYQKENILHTPHMAYYTNEALQKILKISLENMEQFLRGETPLNSLKLVCKKEYENDV